MDDPVLAMLRGQLADIISGAIFSFAGLAVCSIAAIRRRTGVRLFVWLGIWSAMYGAGLLARSQAVVAALPHWLQISVPYVNAMTAYGTVVVAFLAFLELSVGQIRLVLKILIFAGMVVAATGIGWFVFGGPANKFIPYNNVVVVCGLLVLVTVVAVKKLSDKFLVLVNRPVLAFGVLVFTIEALSVNLSRTLPFQTPRLLGHLAFAVLLLSFGHVAVQITFANERRLLFGGTFPHARIFQVFVCQQFRNRGVARELIEYLVKLLERYGYLSAAATVADDLIANGFWEKLGFLAALNLPEDGSDFACSATIS